MLQPRPITAGPRQIEPEVDISESVTLKETLGAAFRLENTLVSGAEAFGVRGDRINARTRISDDGIFKEGPDENYDVFDAIEGTVYEDYSSSFIGVYNQREALVVRRKIDRELEDRRILETQGIGGFAAMLTAGIIDPINIVPIGGTAVRGLKTGQSIAVNASRTAVAGGLGAIAAEIPLQATQETRTAEDASQAVLGGLLLGGIFGGAVGAFVKGDGLSGPTSDLGARVLNSSATETYDFPGGASVGAAQVQNTTAAQESVASSLGAFKALSFQSPMTRQLNSGVADIQRDVMSLVETPYRFNKNDEGLPTTDSRGAVETQVTLARAVAVEAEAQIDDIFIEMRKGRKRQFGDVTKLAVQDKFGRSDAVTISDFKKQVSEAFDIPGEHPDPHIAKAVQVYSNMFTKIGLEAEKLGLIPEGTVGRAVEGGGRYFPIDYNAEAIIANRPEWERILTENFVARAKQYEDELNVVSEDLAKLKRQRAEVEASLPDNATLEIARRGSVDLGFAKRPVTDLLKSIGGVEPGSELAGELAAIDITPRSSPGLFKKGGRTSLDNIVGSEFDVLRDNLEVDISGYVQQDDIIGLIAREVAQDPARTFDELAQIEESLGGIDDLIRFFDDNEIDYQNMTNDQIRQRILRLDDEQIKRVTASRQEGDDGVSGSPRTEADLEAEIAEMEAVGQGAAPKFGKSEADRIEKLEARAETLRKLSVADDPALARELSREVTETILGSSRAHLPENILSGPRGPLKERTLDIDPSLTRAFRNTDITDIGRKYSRTTMVDMELVRKFGHTDMRRQFEKYADAYEAKRNKAVTDRAVKLLKTGKLDRFSKADKDAIKSRSIVRVQEIDDADFQKAVNESPAVTKALNKIDKEEAQTRKDMETMLKRVRGEMVTPRDPNSIWMKAQRTALSMNYLRLLGFQTVSAIPDLAIPIFKYGFRPFTAGWGQMMTNFSNFNMASKELRGAGVGIEMYWDARRQSMSETFVGQSGSSKFEAAVDATNRVYGIATLMTPWNGLLKSVVGHTINDFIYDSVGKLAAGKLSKSKTAELARMNITPEMALRINDQLKKYSPDFKKTRRFNWESWDDFAARDNIVQALPAEVDRIILTPKNTRPSWMSHPVGQLVGQFKSFGFDSAQAIMVAGLQKRDAEAMMGMVTMMALGGLVYKIKEEAAGREVPSIQDEPEKWFVESFDRSGLTGWLMDVNNVAEKLTRGKVGLSGLTGAAPMSRYASRNTLGALIGPTAGLIDDISGVTGAAAQGEWNESDTARLRRLIPFQNALMIRQMFDEFQENFDKALGVDTR